MDFSYILERIRESSFETTPFRHVMIANLFRPDDFEFVTSAPEIRLDPQASDNDLFDSLFRSGYRIIDFPGCITDRGAYLHWRRTRQSGVSSIHSACEGFGMTLRLMQPKSDAIKDLMAFLASADFQQAIARKFGLDAESLVYDAGIQKYLDGYEISPHPDIRRKALTFMVNINPSPLAEKVECHTHYMRFRKGHEYVGAYWAGNQDADRCWVPWDWCETIRQQRQNNSMVIFAPSDDTLHAVKASYDHLAFQRTQLYGNFWHPQKLTTSSPAWEDFVIGGSSATRPAQVGIAGRLPSRIRSMLRAVRHGRATDGRSPEIAARFYQE
jgi:hypothetical protein